MATLAGALVCLLSAVVGYGAVLAAERTRAKRAPRSGSPGVSVPFALPARPPQGEDLSLWADALHSDLGHVYEPAATTSALAREAVYGWPLIDETAVASEAALQ